MVADGVGQLRGLLEVLYGDVLGGKDSSKGIVGGKQNGVGQGSVIEVRSKTSSLIGMMVMVRFVGQNEAVWSIQTLSHKNRSRRREADYLLTLIREAMVSSPQLVLLLM